MKIETQLDYQKILARTTETVHLAVSLKADAQPGGRSRPFAFGLVLDDSASMAGAPLDHAKAAARTVVRHLRAEDFFTLVTFSETARTVVPLELATNKSEIQRRIDAIQPRGCTNLTAGWMLGRDELGSAPEGLPRKLLLLSDGHLNRGIVDPHQVRQIVASGLERDRVRTSVLGFSNHYNEDLLAELATAAGGALHDADSPERFPAIFAQELEALQKLSAQNIRIRIPTLHYCSAVKPVSNYPKIDLPGGGVEIQLGDLVSEEERVLVLALEVLPLPLLPDHQPPASLDGEALLELEFLYDELRPDGVVSRRENHIVRLRTVQNAADVRANEQGVEWVAAQLAGSTIEAAIGDRDRDDLDAVKSKVAEAVALLERYRCPDQIETALRALRDFESLSRNWSARARKLVRAYSSRSRKVSSYYEPDPDLLRTPDTDPNSKTPKSEP